MTPNNILEISHDINMKRQKHTCITCRYQVRGLSQIGYDSYVEPCMPCIVGLEDNWDSTDIVCKNKDDNKGGE